MYPQGGYKTITPIQIANALAALAAGAITFRALRVYLGCFELQAEREAAARVRRAAGEHSTAGVLYRTEELVRLLPDLDVPAVRRELRRLERARLLAFRPQAIVVTEMVLDHARPLVDELSAGRSATRPVPVPRRLLALLCRSRKPTVVKTLLAHFLRGLSIDRRTGEVRAAGTVKASWVARVFGLSERATRAARGELIRLGVISKDTGSHQRKLNRDGAYFRIDLAWSALAHTPSAAAARAGDHSVPTCSPRSAPPPLKKQADFAPPTQRLETPSDLKDQKLAQRERAGCWGRRGEPSIRNIRAEDIRRVAALRKLFEQATAAGWLGRSEASFLAFAAAAVRANRASGDPVRIFVAIVRRKLWHHITQADEDRARAVLGRDRFRSTPGDDRLRDLARRLVTGIASRSVNFEEAAA